MKFKCQDKLRFNTKFNELIVIEGIFNAGDGLHKENAYRIDIAGHKLIFPQAIVEQLFKTVEEKEDDGHKEQGIPTEGKEPRSDSETDNSSGRGAISGGKGRNTRGKTK